MPDLRILIVEDEELYADKLEFLVEKLGYELQALVDNSTDAINQVKTKVPDLILMDVHISGEHDGIELTAMIHREFGDIPVIFITSMRDDLTFNRAARNKPIAFLTKPFDNLQLQRTIELVYRQLAERENIANEPTVVKDSDAIDADSSWGDILFREEFFIKTRQKLVKVSINDVVFLEADGHYCQIHTEASKYLVRLSMSNLMKRLPQELFFQTHRSFLVNLKKVSSVDLQESVVMLGKKQVALSKRNREALEKKLNWI